MKSKAYRATAVNRVDAGQVSQGHAGQPLTVGLDIGKYRVFAVARWPDAQFERPWLVAHPEQLPDLLALLRQLGQEHALTVALGREMGRSSFRAELRCCLYGQSNRFVVQRLWYSASKDAGTQPTPGWPLPADDAGRHGSWLSQTQAEAEYA